MPDRPGRLLDLVHLLAGRRRYAAEEIAEHFGVSTRTIYRDLATLQEKHVPVVHGGRGYALLESARLRPLALTAEERAVLRLALDNPVLQSRPSLRRPLATLRGKLDRVTTAVVETPEALALAGIDRTGAVPDEVVERLEQAVNDRRTVEMRYTSLSGKKISGKGKKRVSRRRRVDPYQIFHRADAWYLAGHCHRNAELRLFRLDRIAQARLLDRTFQVPEGFALESLFDHSWGIFRGRKRHRIVLRFEPSLAPLLESGRHHPGEEIQKTVGGGLEYRVTLDHLDEIARWVVGFGGRCRVVEPEELREKVGELARGVLGG